MSLSAVLSNLQQQRIYQWLMVEVKFSGPGTSLSSRLQTTLKSMPHDARRELVARTIDDCAPLFVASQRGCVDAVLFLVLVCGADVEQRGVIRYRDYKDDCNHRDQIIATPLHSAVIAGYLPVVRALADFGADLDAAADKGVTPLWSACNENRVDLVRFLIGRGVDIHVLVDGNTSLIYCLHSTQLIKMLLQRGADANARSRDNMTALQLAVTKNNVNIVRLLLKYGANPYPRNCDGDDVLQIACISGMIDIVNMLYRRVRYPLERIIDAHEMLAATKLVSSEKNFALELWRIALSVRTQHNLPKQLKVVPREALQFAREFRDETELAAREAATDEYVLHTQALLVMERVLGGAHPHFAYNLKVLGKMHASSGRHQNCVHVCLWALEIHLKCDSLLNVSAQLEMSTVARELTVLFKIMHASHPANSRSPRFQDVFYVFSLLADWLGQFATRTSSDIQVDTLCTKNKYKYVQEAIFGDILASVMHLLHLVLTIVEEAKNKEKKDNNWAQILHKKLHWLVAQDLSNVIMTGNTLLHLSVLQLNLFGSMYLPGKRAPDDQFPSLRCVRALLAAGASPNNRNCEGQSPLYMAAHPEDFNNEIVLELLKAGAHIDQPDCLGRTPADILAENPASKIPLMKYRSLACLAASVIVRHRIFVPPFELPKTLLSVLTSF